ncbi:hypothetical protein [Candidatus Lariskella endosymbiont of Epinotia ramella]
MADGLEHQEERKYMEILMVPEKEGSIMAPRNEPEKIKQPIF